MVWEEYKHTITECTVQKIKQQNIIIKGPTIKKYERIYWNSNNRSYDNMTEHYYANNKTAVIEEGNSLKVCFDAGFKNRQCKLTEN